MTTDVLPMMIGSTGEAVRDLQQRLTALGMMTASVEHGLFDAPTEEALKTFQEQRGLPTTGICDRTSWAALVEAGYQLGDRLLYLRSPMLRGDDVADLQRRLGAIGFDAGRVDGIFGAQTESALVDFERNAGLTTDGVAGPAVIEALGRLGARSDIDRGVAGVREREALRRWHRDLDGKRIAVGHSGGLDALANALTRSLHDAGAIVVVLQHPDPSVQASEANRFESDLYIGLAIASADHCRASYYGTEGFVSTGGRGLADVITGCLATELELSLQEPHGMRTPVLRETRMPAVVCHFGPVDIIVECSSEIAECVSSAVAKWVAEPVQS